MLSFGYILQHGYSFLFVYMLAAALGIPVPADPVFLVMGAMVGNHQYSFFASLLIAVTAMLIGDTLWYQFGRFRGHSVLGFLCKISLEPDTCVRKTESAFAKGGAAALLFAKFIPGTGLLSVSLAGISRMPFGRFLLADTLGAIVWSGSYLLLGLIFHRQLDFILARLGFFGRRAGLIIAVLLLLYAAAKYLERKRFLRKLRAARITPQQALELLESGAPISVIDLRHPAEVERSGMKIAGAVVQRPDDLPSRSGNILENEQIILYCT